MKSVDLEFLTSKRDSLMRKMEHLKTFFLKSDNVSDWGKKTFSLNYVSTQNNLNLEWIFNGDLSNTFDAKIASDLFSVLYERYSNLVDSTNRKIDFLQANNDNQLRDDLPGMKQFIEELEHFAR